MKRTFYPSKRRQGFTLVEVLVSSLLTLIIMAMLFSVLIGTMNAWEGGTSKLQSAGDARLALDILKTDLESLVARQTQYDQEWISSIPLLDTDSNIINTWLTFFSPSLDRNQGQQGDIVALSYVSWYQDPISPNLTGPENEINKIFGLYKAMTTTEEAFTTALDFGGDALLTSDGSGTTGYWTDAPSPPRPEINDPSGFIASNVIQFTVTWLVRKPGASTLTRVDETQMVKLSNTLEVFPDPDNVSGGKIEAAEINLTTLSDEGMRRYAFLAQTGTIPPEQVTQIIREFGTTHTRRVSINY